MAVWEQSPPGLPRGAGSERLADYLRHQKIRYIVYSANSKDWWAGDLEDCRKPETAVPILGRAGGASGRAAYECALDLGIKDFDDNLDGLLHTSRILIESGGTYVLDLAATEAP